MKHLFLILFLFAGTTAFGQLSIDDARAASMKHHLGSYTYHEQFIGHSGYAAPVVLTSDGGAAFFGDDDEGGMLVKIDNKGADQWKISIRPQFDELESQSVVQDAKGNFYVFMLSYDHNKYRGGCQRIAYVDKKGVIVWDKMISSCELVNNPLFSYIRLMKDGKISLRGHVVTEQPAPDKDPQYHYWEGWLDEQGNLTQKSGEVIDWSKQEWQKFYEPEL